MTIEMIGRDKEHLEFTKHQLCAMLHSNARATLHMYDKHAGSSGGGGEILTQDIVGSIVNVHVSTLYVEVACLLHTMRETAIANPHLYHDLVYVLLMTDLRETLARVCIADQAPPTRCPPPYTILGPHARRLLTVLAVPPVLSPEKVAESTFLRTLRDAYTAIAPYPTAQTSSDLPNLQSAYNEIVPGVNNVQRACCRFVAHREWTSSIPYIGTLSFSYVIVCEVLILRRQMG